MSILKTHRFGSLSKHQSFLDSLPASQECCILGSLAEALSLSLWISNYAVNSIITDVSSHPLNGFLSSFFSAASPLSPFPLSLASHFLQIQESPQFLPKIPEPPYFPCSKLRFHYHKTLFSVSEEICLFRAG